MKKILSLIMATVMLLAICSTAFATTFTRTANCASENSPYVASVNVSSTKAGGTQVKINHNATGCSNSFSNHFRVQNKTSGKQVGSKWVTPGGSYFISCSTFAVATYYVDMRGNTKYHDEEGLDTIGLTGWFLLPCDQ